MTFTKEKIKTDTVFWMSCIIAFSLPMSKQAVGIAAGVSALFALINFRYYEMDVKMRRQFWLLVLFYLTILLAYLYTENSLKGLHHIEMKLALLAFPVIFALNPKLDKRKIEIILAFFIAAMVLACLISLGYALYRYMFEKHIYKQNIFFFYYNDLINPFKLSPAYYSLYVGFATLLLVVYLIENAVRLKRAHIVLISLVVILLSGFNILLSARMPLFAFVFSLVFLFSARLTIKSWSGYIAIAIFLGAIGVFIVSNDYTLSRISKVNSLSYDIENPDFKAWNAVTTRVAIWSCSWEVIRSNAFLGVGPGDSNQELFAVYRSKGFNYGLNERYNAHNQYLQVLMGIGIVGLTIFLITLATQVKTAFKRADWYYIVFLLLVIPCFLTESYLDRLKGVLFYGFFSSLLYFCKRN